MRRAMVARGALRQVGDAGAIVPRGAVGSWTVDYGVGSKVGQVMETPRVRVC